MPNKYTLSARTIHSIEIRDEELAEKLREIALETDNPVSKHDIFIFVPDLAHYADSEIKAIYSEAKNVATWLRFELLID
jgi:exonuclease V gamma subunit